MPSDLDRLSAVVRTVEHQADVYTPDPVPAEEEQPLRWMVLTAALPAATSTTLSGLTITVPQAWAANANPANWEASANSNAGGYVIDTATSYAVVETTGQRSYASGAWLLCRPLLTPNGAVWEPVGPPASPAASFPAYGSLWNGAGVPADGDTKVFSSGDASTGLAASASAGTITISTPGKWRIRAMVEFSISAMADGGGFYASFDLNQDGSAVSGATAHTTVPMLGSLGSPSALPVLPACLEWQLTTTSTPTTLKLVVHLDPYGAFHATANGNASLMVEQVA